MRKLLWLTVVLSVMIASFGIVGGATPTTGVKLEVSSGSGGVGDTVDIYVDLTENSGIVSLNFGVVFDATKLELKSNAITGYPAVILVTGILQPDVTYHGNGTIPGGCILSWEDSVGASNITSTGRIAKLSFKIISEFTGSLPITIIHNPNNVFDFNQENVPLTYTAGAIEYEARPAPAISSFGAGIRLSTTKTGIRFGTVIAKDDFYKSIYTNSTYVYSSTSNLIFGTLIIPKSLLTGELTIDKVTGTAAGAIDVIAKNIYEETADTIKFTGVLYNIPTTQYSATLVARAYVKYRASAEDEYVYRYADPIERTYAGIAQAAINAGATGDDLVILQSIVDAAN